MTDEAKAAIDVFILKNKWRSKMEVVKSPDIWYQLAITISEQELKYLESYVDSGPKYTGAAEFADLVQKIRGAVGKTLNTSEMRRALSLDR